MQLLHCNYIYFERINRDKKLIGSICVSLVHSKHLCFVFFLFRGYVFRPQTQEIKERGGNQSTGIDFFITQERIIFLDTQVKYASIYHKLWELNSHLGIERIVIWVHSLYFIFFFSQSSARLFWTTWSTMIGSCLQSTTSLTHMLRCRLVAGLQMAAVKTFAFMWALAHYHHGQICPF